MNKKDKAIEYFNYLVKTNPHKTVELKYYIRVYDENCVEASTQPFILDKDCIFCVVEYVLWSGEGFDRMYENIQLYINNEGDTLEFAPYKNGKLKIDFQSWDGYQGKGHYKGSFNLNGMTLTYDGYPPVEYLSFYELFLSYAGLVEKCSSQSEVDYLKKCLEKDIKIEELNMQNIAKDAKIRRLEELVDSYKDLMSEIKKLVQKNL